MIAFDKYGKMTPGFKAYQQAAWDVLRARAKVFTRDHQRGSPEWQMGLVKGL